MFETVLNPALAEIWRKNMESLPLETRQYLNRAADMLIAECARVDISVKRQLIKAWLGEVAYGSESRHHFVSGCGNRMPDVIFDPCRCRDGYGHKWPSVKWTDLVPQETVFDVIYSRTARITKLS
jgi:hypothetical protein